MDIPLLGLDDPGALLGWTDGLRTNSFLGRLLDDPRMDLARVVTRRVVALTSSEGRLFHPNPGPG